MPGLIPDKRHVLFAVLKVEGHVYQIVWEPGYEAFAFFTIEKWVMDNELRFNADNAEVLLHAMRDVAQRNNQGLIEW